MKTITIIRSLFATAASSILLAGCSNEELLPQDGTRTPVNFTAAVQTAQPAATPQTRTAIGEDGNSVWIEGDKVALLMYTAGGEFHKDYFPDVFYKKFAVNPANGTLIPDDGVPVYYPEEGAVDFIAWYPYMNWSPDTGYFYKSQSDQTTEAKHASADILFSNNATNIRSGKDAVELRFRHLLSKLRLDIILSEGLTNGTVESVVINGTPNIAYINLEDGSMGTAHSPGVGPISSLRLTTPTAGAAATYVAIVSPHDSSAYPFRTIVVTVDGIDYTGTIPDADTYAPNTMYVYPVTVQNTIVTVGTATIVPWEDLEPEEGDVL